MKCPKCDGKGKTTEYDGLRKFWCDYKCEVCNGTGEVEMTNEEYLKSCNTEQLAEWLSEKLYYCQTMWYWACDKCTWSKKHESCMNDKEKWMEWLKQPHREG